MESLPVIALAVTNLALVIGWFVSGTQRVTETVTVERRKVYSDFIVCAREVRKGGHPEPGIEELAQRAEVVASDEMLESKLIRRLEKSALSGDDWERIRERFLTAARLESLQNSSRKRRLLRSAVYRQN